jgi:hypothetical protein
LGLFRVVTETFSDAVDRVEDTVDDAVDFVEETADELAGDAVAAASAAGDAAQDTYEAAGDIASAVIDPVMDEVVSPVGDALLSGLQDSGFFDVVDYASLDLIDMSYGDNGFTLDFGIEDVVGYTFNAGNGGISFEGDYGGQHLGLAWNDDGFSASAALGIDWGPLPYTEAHGGVAPDGDLGVGGEWQGYFPLPGGMVGGHTAADYQETDDGFRTSWDVTTGIYEPTGEYVGVGTHGSYSEDKDGYALNLGVHAEAGQEGVINARGSFDYDEARHGDVRTQGVSASATVEDEVTHTTVEGRIGYQHTETSQGDYDTIFGEGEVRGEGFEIGGNVSGTLGPDGSVTVAGSGHAAAGGYEIAAHGSATVGPDGEVTARGGIDELGVPDDVPGLDDLPTDGIPGLDDLPTDGIPGLDDLPTDGIPGLDDLPTDGIPGLDDLPTDGIPGLDDLPTDGIPGLDRIPDAPDPGSLVQDGLQRVQDEGSQLLDDALRDAPAPPDVPATPDVPAAPDPPAFPDPPATPESPDGLPF